MPTAACNLTSPLSVQAQSNLVKFHTELVADMDTVAVRRSFMQCAISSLTCSLTV